MNDRQSGFLNHMWTTFFLLIVCLRFALINIGFCVLVPSRNHIVSFTEPPVSLFVCLLSGPLFFLQHSLILFVCNCYISLYLSSCVWVRLFICCDIVLSFIIAFNISLSFLYPLLPLSIHAVYFYQCSYFYLAYYVMEFISYLAFRRILLLGPAYPLPPSFPVFQF